MEDWHLCLMRNLIGGVKEGHWHQFTSLLKFFVFLNQRDCLGSTFDLGEFSFSSMRVVFGWCDFSY